MDARRAGKVACFCCFSAAFLLLLGLSLDCAVRSERLRSRLCAALRERALILIARSVSARAETASHRSRAKPRERRELASRATVP